MKLNLTKFERTAGVFVLLSFLGFIFFTAFVAYKQGWFESKYTFKTTFLRGEGLHSGTSVQMSGLRAGTVTNVTLSDDNKIVVTMSISGEFAKKIKPDSVAKVVRPFIIGDKVVEITLGEADGPRLANNIPIPSVETMDIMDLLGGGQIAPYLETLDGLLVNLKVIAEAFSDPRRSEAVIGMFDQILPTLLDIRELAQQATRKKALSKTLEQTSLMLPHFTEFSKRLPELGDNGARTLEQMNKLTEELNKILPLLAEMAPEASQKSVEALREAVVVLKAMQRSFLLRGAVEDIKKEEEKLRLPATENK
ncbi:MAG: MCE family protein [Oligoflexia bacterium]|nr:MCE family protein [Oligoflexia bacterium]